MRKLVLALTIIVATSMYAKDIVGTSAYRWVDDSIVQGEYKAWAVSPYEIQSTYSARPHYFMPIEKSWKLKNDISSYPTLQTGNKLLEAVYNMGLDEMVNAVEPDTTLRTGKEWAGVWTRDVSYSIILSMAYMQPEAAMISLRKKVNKNGRIIQDTGSGGAWPISSDRMVWALAAWEIYKVTGDKEWLEYAYPIVKNSFEDDFKTVYKKAREDMPVMVCGETSFIDWREQSYPKWMQTADIYQSQAMNTNVVHAAGLEILSQMATVLGKKKEAIIYAKQSAELVDAINKVFYMPEKGYYGMYVYGREYPILNPREETLGESLAILYGIAGPEQAVAITENSPLTPYGAAIFFPQISDMPSYHNNALWPFVGSYWALANAKAGNEEGTMQAIGAIVRPAALFATNKENFNLDNGDIFTELNSSNMLWSLSGNLALTNRILFGINFEPEGLKISPVVPQALADTRTLSNFPYRGAKLKITVSGYGNKVKSLSLNGKELNPEGVIPAKLLKGDCAINVVMADNKMATTKVNLGMNVKAPITPLTRIELDPATGKYIMAWNPIEYIGKYKIIHNGEPVGYTHQTTWPIDNGEWQVVGVSGEGVESFASEPLHFGKSLAIQIPGEGESILSKEVSYIPDYAVEGYRGDGFVETDHISGTITIPVEIEEGGDYALRIRYSNGNGPVNTENKCAIRSVLLNGSKVGTIVLPQRGVNNWNDWGYSNVVMLNLSAGKNEITISFLQEDENMNLGTNHALIDEVILTKLR